MLITYMRERVWSVETVFEQDTSYDKFAFWD